MNPASAARLRLRGAIVATAAAAVKAGPRTGQAGRRTQQASEAGTAAAWPDVQASNENKKQSATTGTLCWQEAQNKRRRYWISAFAERAGVRLVKAVTSNQCAPRWRAVEVECESRGRPEMAPRIRSGEATVRQERTKMNIN